jgi:hypothetical protein
MRYDAYKDFKEVRVLRQFGAWSIEAACLGGIIYVLVAVNHDTQTLIGCCYADRGELTRDIALLESIPPDDTDSSGVLAPLIPDPPSPTPGYRQPLPNLRANR